ncbi:MAG TPA: OsmC family protein [Gaiellaceae bacterium]|nr:OsmC family protein [Gaiellaceae bacterium]
MSRSTTLTASVRIEGDRHELRESGPDASAWRGAELLVAAVASGYAAELAAAAERLAIPVASLEVDAVGHLTARRDGRHAFVGLELAAAVDTGDDHCERLQLAAEVALDRCPVVGALDVPLSHTVRLERARLQEVPS